MLILDGKTDLNQISLTGVRAITMIGLLIIKPRSLEEIREKFLEHKIMDKSHSDDILRIDMNTIKSMGCEISRPSPKTDYKYILSKHPFMLNFTEQDISILKKVFGKIKNNLDISLVMEYDRLLKKIAGHISDETIRENFAAVSPFTRYDSDLIYDLITDCRHRNTIELMYHKSAAQKINKRKLIAQKLVFRNDKIYLYGFNTEINAPIMLNVKHITGVTSREITQNPSAIKGFRVRFHLKNTEPSILNDDETVLDEGEGKILAEGNYFNNFVAAQRILSLGSKCTVEEPYEFKNYIISKLKELRRIYEEDR